MSWHRFLTAAEITGWLDRWRAGDERGARPAVRRRAPAAAPARRAPAAARAPRPHARAQRRRQRALPAPHRQPAGVAIRTGPTSSPSPRRRCAASSSTMRGRASPTSAAASSSACRCRTWTAGRAAASSEQLLDLDTQLSALAAADPRAARVVELRFFGGLREEDVAEVLQVSVDHRQARLEGRTRLAGGPLCSDTPPPSSAYADEEAYSHPLATHRPLMLSLWLGAIGTAAADHLACFPTYPRLRHPGERTPHRSSLLHHGRTPLGPLPAQDTGSGTSTSPRHAGRSGGGARPTSTVVEAQPAFWLYTIAEESWLPVSGRRGDHRSSRRDRGRGLHGALHGGGVPAGTLHHVVPAIAIRDPKRGTCSPACSAWRHRTA